MKDLQTISAVAQQLDVSPHAVRRWIARGVGRPVVKLRAIRVGGSYRITQDAVDEFLTAISDPELHRKRRADERTEAAKRRLIQAGA